MMLLRGCPSVVGTGIAIVAWCGLNPSQVQAQRGYGARVDMTAATNYVWRGVATEAWNGQLGAAGWVEWSETYVSVGAWALGLPLKLDDPRPNRHDERARVPLHNELDLWVEVGRRVGPTHVTLGAAWYVLNWYEAHSSTYAPLPNTAEFYGKVSTTFPLPNELSFWSRLFGPSATIGSNLYYDIDRVRGFHLEGFARMRLPLPAYDNSSGLYLEALGGWNFDGDRGQTFRDSDGAGYFSEQGLTRWELSSTLPISVIAESTTVSPFVKTVFARRVVHGHARTWWGVTVSVGQLR